MDVKDSPTTTLSDITDFVIDPYDILTIGYVSDKGNNAMYKCTYSFTALPCYTLTSVPATGIVTSFSPKYATVSDSAAALLVPDSSSNGADPSYVWAFPLTASGNPPPTRSPTTAPNKQPTKNSKLPKLSTPELAATAACASVGGIGAIAGTYYVYKYLPNLRSYLPNLRSNRASATTLPPRGMFVNVNQGRGGGFNVNVRNWNAEGML